MVVSDLVVKPKTHKGRLVAEGRAPKLIEDPKKTVFIRGQNASGDVVQAIKDLCTLKRPNAQFLGRKNAMLPFEDATPLEFVAKKSECSLFGFGSHTKKRPHNLILGRTFDYFVLDMFEFGVEQFKPLSDFKCSKITAGAKPMLIFAGDQFDRDRESQRLKNFLVDFFVGPRAERVDRAGLEHVIQFVLDEDTLMIRSYKVRPEKSGQTTPRVELQEIGPRLDLKLRRNKLASDDLYKTSRRQPTTLKPKKKKNITKDVFGSSMGRIHMERQDFGRLQTRKMKGLKKGGFTVTETEPSEERAEEMDTE